MHRLPRLALPALVIAGVACTRLEPFRCSDESPCPVDADVGSDAGLDAPRVDAAPPGCGDGEVREHVEECDPPGPTCTSSCLTCASPNVISPDGHCWELTSVGTYAAGHAACVIRPGGHVASPISAEEQNGPLTAMRALADDQVFVGLGDARTDGTFLYATGETAGVPPWAISEPNGGTDENCVAAGTDGWLDLACAGPRATACEREAPIVRPTTGTAYRRDFATRDAFAAASGCAFGGGPAILADADELAFLQLTLPVGADCGWVGGSVGLDGVLQWIAPGGASTLPWAPGEPSQIGCLCVSAAGLGVRGCDNLRETLCEIP